MLFFKGLLENKIYKEIMNIYILVDIKYILVFFIKLNILKIFKIIKCMNCLFDI